MDAPLVLVTGFGPFPGRAVNPSRDVAHALEREPPAGVRVLARELPVTFRGAPQAIRAALAELAPARPAALLGLGVAPEPCFRLERRARGAYSGERVDNDGATPDGLSLELGPMRASDVDLERLAEVLRAAGAPEVRLSDDAGGYVCEVCYHTLLGEARGAPTVFLHVPPAEVLDAAAQTPIVRALVAALVRQAPTNRRRFVD